MNLKENYRQNPFKERPLQPAQMYIHLTESSESLEFMAHFTSLSHSIYNFEG